MDTTRMTPETIIFARNVCIVNEENRDIIHDVSFDVRRETILGIFGESGAGKTLIGRAVASKLPWGIKLSSGKIDYDTHATPITMVPQSSHASLPPLMSVYNLIASVLRWNGLTGNAKEVQSILDKVGFLPELNPQALRPHQLSGGLALRVSIAAALATSPKTLILDEPTSSLDPISAHDLAGIIRLLNTDQKKTIIIITHDVQWARKVCSDYLIITKGRSICSGNIEEVDSINDEYIKKLFGKF